MRMLGNVLLVISLLELTQANIILNGDFESGEVKPWRCVGCQCESSQNYLGRISEGQANVLLSS